MRHLNLKFLDGVFLCDREMFEIVPFDKRSAKLLEKFLSYDTPKLELQNFFIYRSIIIKQNDEGSTISLFNPLLNSEFYYLTLCFSEFHYLTLYPRVSGCQPIAHNHIIHLNLARIIEK